MQAVQGSVYPKIHYPLLVLGFVQGRIQNQATIEFKVKEGLLVKQGDRVATPQTEQSLSTEIYLFYWGSFNRGAGHSIEGREYSGIFQERSGDFS